MITRLLLFIAALWILHQIIKQVRALLFRSEERKETDRLILGGEMVQDPVCHVYVPKTTAIPQRVDRRIYYFCSRECVEKFYDSLKA